MFCCMIRFLCGADGCRSRCLVHAKHALYHLSYSPKYQEWDSNPRSITHNILSVTPLTARESWQKLMFFGFLYFGPSDLNVLNAGLDPAASSS